MGNWMAVGLLAPMLCIAASGQEKAKPKERVVSVHLSFSVEEYDPSKPSKAVIRCVVQNDSPLPVHVPVGYEGGYVQMQAGGLSLVKNKKEKEDVKLAWVEPGQQQEVFELSLDDIFLVAEKRIPAWHWQWQRRPAPPLSPIHKSRTLGLVDQASFIVSLDLGGSTLKSEAATLKVKAGGEK